MGKGWRAQQAWPCPHETFRRSRCESLSRSGRAAGPICWPVRSPRSCRSCGADRGSENIPGAGATAGPAQVAKSPADGHTLLINTNAQAYSAALAKDLPYDPVKDFIPIVPLTRQAYVLVAGKATGVTSVGELIAVAKAKPGEL